MPWIYDQLSASLYAPNGTEVTNSASGSYSGNFRYANYPPAQGLSFAGPIPKGRYKIGESYHHPHLGPLTMDLSPDGHSALGRTEFRIHGSSGHHSSAGCIILGPDIRLEIAVSVDRTLEVR